MTKKLTKQALKSLIESMVKKQISEGPAWKPGMPIPPVKRGKGRYDPDEDVAIDSMVAQNMISRPSSNSKPEEENGFKSDFDVFVNGKFYPFFGAHSNMFKMGKNVFEAVEADDDDRMMSDTIRVVTEPVTGFFGQPIAEVKVVKIPEYRGYDFGGYQLVDKSGHVWLTFGTADWYDYYPILMFDYTPPGH